MFWHRQAWRPLPTEGSGPGVADCPGWTRVALGSRPDMHSRRAAENQLTQGRCRWSRLPRQVEQAYGRDLSDRAGARRVPVALITPRVPADAQAGPALLPERACGEEEALEPARPVRPARAQRGGDGD